MKNGTDVHLLGEGGILHVEAVKDIWKHFEDGCVLERFQNGLHFLDHH